MDDADKEAKRKTAYKSRLSRARTANLEKRGLTSQRTDESESMANMAFSIPVQQEVDMEALGNKRAATWSNPSTPQSAKPTKTVKKIETEITTFAKPDSEESIAAHWEWNSTQKLLAVAEQTQLLKVIDESGKTIYRVQVSRETSPWLARTSAQRAAAQAAPLSPLFYSFSSPTLNGCLLPRLSSSLFAAAARGAHNLPWLGALRRRVSRRPGPRRRLPMVPFQAGLRAAVGGHAVLVADDALVGAQAEQPLRHVLRLVVGDAQARPRPRRRQLRLLGPAVE